MKKIRLYAFHQRTVCYILWFLNITYLTSKYFAYRTQVDLGFYAPVTLTLPNLSLCFDLNTILGGHEVFVFDDHSPQYLGMTSKQIFDRVPNVDRVVKRCAYRDPVSDEIIQVENSTECHQLFTVKRYRMNSFICYLFHLKKRHNFSFNSLAFSINEPKLLYNVAIKGLLTEGHAVVPLLHLDELADVDRIYMKEIFPPESENKLYHLEYILYEIERLPRPYETRCDAEPQLRCLYKCYVHEYSKSGFVTSSSVVRETDDLGSTRVVRYNGTEEETRFRLRITRTCSKICPSEACRQKLVITDIFGPFTRIGHKFSVNVGSFRSPINLMKHSPKLSLADYMTQLFSLSGIWIGFSAVSLIYRRKRFDLVSTYNIWIVLRAKLPSYCQTRTNQRAEIKKVKRRKLRQSKRFISIAFKFFILLIFSVQALNLCLVYSKYETILTYQHSLNPEFEYRLPSTVICVDISDLLSSQGQTSVTEENYEDILTKKNTWINLTLDQIFDQTIGEEILFKCRTKSYEFMEYFKGKFQLKSGEECLKEEFSFHKYYSRWQMCYLFKPKQLPRNLASFQQHSLAFTEINPAKLYSLILNPRIKHYSKIDLIVYFDDSNAPYDSSDFRAISPSLADKRVVILTFHTIIYEYLPSPYNTRCDPVQPKSKCLNECQEKKLMQLDRLPYSNLVKNKLKKKLMSFEDLKNSTINAYYRKAEKHCHEKCNRVLCAGNYTLTFSRHAIDQTIYNVEVAVSLESIPRTRHSAVPCFEFYDFLYQMFCLFAFWLGFSFVGLNFIRNTRERRFNQAAKVLYSETIKLFLSLRSFRGKIGPICHKKANALKRNLVVKRAICYSLCVVGMCSHLALPISQYLAYPTKLLTAISNEEPVPYELIVCAEAQDLFERRLIFGKNRATSDQYLLDRKLDEILREAEKMNHSMTACGYWGLSGEENRTNEMKTATDRVFFDSNNSSVCEKSFHKKVILNQGYICFVYRLKRKAEWNLSQMLASINRAKVVLSVSFNSTIISPRFTIMAHQYLPGAMPLHTSVWSPQVYMKTGQNRFVVSYFTFIVERLPFPYSDKDFIPPSITYCILRCTNDKMSQFNITRIAFGDEPPHNKLLSSSYRKSSLVNRLTNQMDGECERKCLKDINLSQIKIFYMGTIISEPLASKTVLKGSIRFDLRRTDDPVVSMKFLADIPIYDLIINIGSVISIWFGLSVISIPDLASEDDMEKMYIRTVDNLEATNNILRHIHIDRGTVNRRTVGG